MKRGTEFDRELHARARQGDVRPTHIIRHVHYKRLQNGGRAGHGTLRRGGRRGEPGFARATGHCSVDPLSHPRVALSAGRVGYEVCPLPPEAKFGYPHLRASSVIACITGR